ncbi:DEAD/DEAH box helicase family protein [Xanthomarina sp. F1114]|uniref:DEAD/DEAH box helicase family protein n=1 Tax=Xanthomarina sp. F1114 TaxID=2996019 RepID=UPI00225E431D|nr:DEAD/DEAH box helicase family protein [Xanthomarina sp. F1114]MCX7547721.1 DEAD/DEAH box helicase family protein [Xanthomarina sp. F1114]
MPKNLFIDLQFVFPWRTYQENFLNNFSAHISDNHFHVIAPPGSGKTVLGLEIVKRIGKKTLILAPNLTIRNQWEDRLQNFFVKGEIFKPVSFDIRALSDINFSTYQSLHSFYKSFEDKAEYFKYFKDHDIETIVLDEAHHLKNTWWTCLYELKSSSLYTMVALTATPPYDSGSAEISKYFQLCGEIDDEIATPDLVKEGNLCPHQDFVYLSKPSDLEINYIFNFRQKIVRFINDLKTDQEFKLFLKRHRFYRNTTGVIDEIYSNPEFFSAIIIFLKTSGEEIPFEKLAVLGFEKKDKIEIPPLTNNWVELLLQNIIDDKLNLLDYEDKLPDLEKTLRKLNVLDTHKVNLIGNNRIYKSLFSSPSKLRSIVKIIAHESHNLGNQLQSVILTDYIRKEFLNSAENAIKNINKLGVVPIFQNLRISIEDKKMLAVLSGSLVIIHAALLADFYFYEKEKDYKITPLECDGEYVIVEEKTNSKKSLVGAITRLFESGKLKILVGTKSLLGEGWDAPAINTLILASFVGSFVTSNQMRGRAIRSQIGNPSKTGNIWHLACVDPTTDNGGRDLEILKRRFDAFLGISNTEENYISNGFERLGIPETIKLEDVDIINRQTLVDSSKRSIISNKWEKAIFQGSQLGREVNYHFQGKKPYPIQKKIYYNDAVKYTMVELTITLLVFLPEFFVKNFNILFSKGIIYFMYSLLGFLGLNFGVKAYKAIQLYLRYGMIHKDIEKMAHAILDTLLELQHITSDKSQIKIETELLERGDVICSIKGANQIESKLFINALEELLQPIGNPRYIIVKDIWYRKKLDIQNYFPVPKLFGDNKERSDVFLKHWKNYMGKSKMFYTRHLEGRKILVKARLFHISGAKEEVTKKSIIWK